MPAQHLILEDTDATYHVLIESDQLIHPSPSSDDDLEPYDPNPSRRVINPPTIPPEMRVKLADVHRTIQGYTQYAIGAFKNLAIAEVEEITLKFKLKISAEGGIPMIASGKTESDFEIEVKCKFPENKTPQS
jgi:Trypsin-co-occurring domain 1